MWMLIILVINNLLLYVPSAIMCLDRSNPSEMYLAIIIITVKPQCKVLDCSCTIQMITLYSTLRTILATILYLTKACLALTGGTTSYLFPLKGGVLDPLSLGLSTLQVNTDP